MNDINKNEERKSIALLIDSENFSAKYIRVLRDELHELGDIIVARAYGNAASVDNKEEFRDYGILSVLQPPYTQNKNSSDIRIVIDAMDIMQKNKVNCFCLATSDSDFAPLAIRLKEEGMTVIGAGEEKAPKAFRNICHRFILVDAILKGIEARKTSKGVAPKGKGKKTTPREADSMIIELVKSIDKFVDANKDADGYALFSTVIDQLGKAQTDFSPKNYGATSTHIMSFFKDFLNKYYEFDHTGTIVKVRKMIDSKKN